MWLRHQCGFATNVASLPMWLRHQRLTNSNALREYKQTITLNPIQKDVIVGTLLGDASIPLDIGKPKVPTGPPTLRVRFEQNIARENYIWHLYDVFKDPVGILCRHTSTSTQ